jgi:predicted ATPase
MALFTLLLQPEEDLPDMILIDEPELGLHPSAIQLLSSLLRSVSTRTQVIVATQSVPLVDQFEPEDIVVVERDDAGTVFRRLESEELRSWLEEYSLGELWQKNVIGGRP